MRPGSAARSSSLLSALLLVLASQAVTTRGGLWSAPSQSADRLLSIPSLLDSQHILLVLDPNWRLCYDTVDVDNFARAGLLPWVAQLRDALTVGEHNPEGSYLKASTQSQIRHGTAPSEHAGADSYHDLMEQVLADGNATVQLPSMLLLLYELSMVQQTLVDGSGCAHAFTLSPERLRVTTTDSFWAAVELTADSGLLTGPDLANYSELQTYEVTYPPSKHDPYLPEPTAIGAPDHSVENSLAAAPTVRLASIAGSVVIFPQIVPALLNHSSRRPLTQAHADPYAWNLARVRAMLAAFLNATGTTSIPPLEEYTQLPDKVYLQRAYEAFHAQDPAARVPPIPTAVVRAPGSAREHALLCYSSEKFAATEAHVDATMRAIFDALLLLEDALPGDSPVRHVQERDAEQRTRSYVLKRNLSNAAVHVITLTLPDWMLAAGCLLDVSITAKSGSNATSLPCQQGDSRPWRAAPTMALPPDLSTGAVGTRMYLRAAAEVLARESCGEPWLLQPKIQDMDKLEYRVYLLGGAEATGGPNDTAVYYVSGDVQSESLETRRGLGAVGYMTVMPGYFWSDSLFPPGHDTWVNLAESSRQGGNSSSNNSRSSATPHAQLWAAEDAGECSADEDGQDNSTAAADGGSASRDGLRRLWPQEVLYDNIVQAALENVRAVAAADLHRSSARALFARADVVLAWHSSEEDTHLVPLINEVSLLNSASKLIDLWRGPKRDSHWPPELAAQYAHREALPTEEQVRSGWGYTLARVLAREATRSFLADLHCAELEDAGAGASCHDVVVQAE